MPPERVCQDTREKAAAEKQDKSFATILARYIKARRRDGVRSTSL